jgi:hypothetical protein
LLAAGAEFQSLTVKAIKRRLSPPCEYGPIGSKWGTVNQSSHLQSPLRAQLRFTQSQPQIGRQPRRLTVPVKASRLSSPLKRYNLSLIQLFGEFNEAFYPAVRLAVVVCRPCRP